MKHRLGEVDVGLGGGFPGEIAGASLKQALERFERECHVRDSPAKSPGPH